MNEASALRRRTDLAKLRELQARVPKILEIFGVSGDPLHSIKLRIRIPTAINNSYPQKKQEVSEVEIDLPENYPFPPGPIVHFSTPIWNPNVYSSGKWCFGDWKITENLELFTIRLMKVIALDPTIINPRSAANRDAAEWYERILSTNPKIFPTISLIGMISEVKKPTITWRNIK